MDVDSNSIWTCSVPFQCRLEVEVSQLNGKEATHIVTQAHWHHMCVSNVLASQAGLRSRRRVKTASTICMRLKNTTTPAAYRGQHFTNTAMQQEEIVLKQHSLEYVHTRTHTHDRPGSTKTTAISFHKSQLQ
jgi:hypothetical protein